MKSSDLPTCFLFDNGSLRAASTLNLRVVAKALEKEIGAPVRAVSLLHSSGVDAGELGGERAQLLEPALQTWLTEQQPSCEAVLLPFFFGPSGALTEYLPGRIEVIRDKFPDARLGIGKWLVDSGENDERLGCALVDAVTRTIREANLAQPKVVVVDHGSPQRGVAAVRDHLAAQVARLMASEVEALGVASMERRPGPEYAFNDPLLAERLRAAPFDTGDVVVALQFLSPGRHAGAGGDIAEICEAAKKDRPGLRTWISGTIGADARVVSVLADRYREAVARMRG